MADRSTELQNRLAVYQRLTGDPRGGSSDSTADQRLQFDKEKFDFEKSFRVSEQTRKSEASDARAARAEEKIGTQAEQFDARAKLYEQQLELQKKKEDLAIQDQITKNDRSAFILDQATKFLADAAKMKLSPSDTNFDQKRDELAAKYTDAYYHPSVQHWDAAHSKQRQEYIDRQAQADARKEKQRSAADMQDALIGGSLTFGHIDEKGKIKPDTAGMQATHVSSFYQDPTTGKMISTPPMPIDDFKAFQAKAAARKAAQPAIPIDTTSGPVIAPVGAPVEPIPAVAAASSASGYANAEEVRNAYQSGKLPKDKAADILRTEFGHK